MPQPDRSTARQLASESLARGDATGWFETLYQNAQGAASAIPWADLHPNPALASWLAQEPQAPLTGRALVVGCGLGDDAEALAARGLAVTAFDVAPTAVKWCLERFGNSTVDYCVADLLDPPSAFRGAFDFVFEAYTLQVLPPDVRAKAATQLAELVAPGGKLLLVARARSASEDAGNMPWPLTRWDLHPLTDRGLSIESFEEYFDDEDPPVRRFRVLYRRR